MKNTILTLILILSTTLSFSQKLYRAVEKGDLEKVTSLIVKGHDVNELTNEGKSPLWRAAIDGNIEISQLLVDSGASIKSNYAPLRIAARNGDLEIVKLLVENGAELDYKTMDGSTALARASSRGHQDIVAYLIEKGADVNTVDRLGNSPLGEAAIGGFTTIIKTLIDNGARLDHTNKKNQTIVDRAESKGKYKVIQLLTI